MPYLISNQSRIFRGFLFINMKFLEKDLEQIIYSADKELLAQRGLEINGTLIRQLRIGNYRGF